METWVKAPFLRGASVLIVSQCIRSVFPKIWDKFTENRITLTSCPEAEGFSGLTEKLATLIRCSSPKEITILTVEGSPHCRMLHTSMNGAVFLTKADIPIEHLVIVGEDDVRKISPESVRLGRYLHLVERCIRRCPDLVDDLESLSLEQRDAKSGKTRCL
ncbi:MAG: 4Fe-4S ferredoxin [Candidatus Bathyarchaeia archaeon]